jgi:DNA (cytosine-5)-methyltransferase 1
MKQSTKSVGQGRLFGARGAVERFHVDESTGVITRSVTRRDPDTPPVVTVVGEWDRRTSLDDVRAAADLAYLRLRRQPEWSHAELPVRVVDLFSGCGAMSLGVSEACRALGKGVEHVAGFDVHPRIAEVYGRNFGLPDTTAYDLAECLQGEVGIAPTEAERALVERLGEVDFVCAGPPCQGHSNLNNKTRRDDPKNALYFLVARFAELTRPRWIIVENVISVLHDKARVVERTKEALEALGYVTTDGIVDLWSLGVAQTRRRHVMVAQRRAGPVDGWERRELDFLEDLIAPYMTRRRPVSWAIDDLLNVTEESFFDRPRVPDPITQSRIDYLFDHDLYNLPKSQRPPSHKGEHGDSYKAVYGRMRWEDAAPTMTGGFLTMGQGRFVHPKRRRTITAHEAARIQSIPDFFDFSSLADNRGVLAETIGNAVPPKLSYVLGLELMR